MALNDIIGFITSIGSPFLFSLILLGWTCCFAKLLGFRDVVRCRLGFSPTKNENSKEIPLGLSLFNATSFLSLSIFFTVLLGGNATFLAYVLLSLGLIFLYLGRVIFNPSSNTFLRYFICLSTLGLVAAFGLRFRSIDDYSFWGPISKYLFQFQALPDNDNYIHASFLSYTPIMACFHYLLFSLSGRYSQFLGYFAQSLVFVSALVVFWDDKNPTMERTTRIPIVNMSIVFILFFLAYGFVLGRMEVDAYVAVYFLASCWIIYKGTVGVLDSNESRGKDTLLCVALPLLFLSVIKEIGLLFAIFSLIYYLILAKPKDIKTWISSFSLLLSLLAIKILWKHHVLIAGFKSFSSGIGVTNAIQTLNLFNTQYHSAQLLFLKEALFANFDHVLKIPYIVMYMLMTGIYYFILKKHPEHKKNVQPFMLVFSIIAVIYLLMLYFLQAIVFQAGSHSNKILDFSRYYNMLFLPWLSMLILVSLDIVKPRWLYQSRKSAIICIIFSAIFFIAGKTERSFKFYDNAPFNTILYQIEQIKSAHDSSFKMNGIRNLNICLQNPPGLAYQIGMPLRYFLMPDKVYYPVRKENEGFCDLVVQWDDDKRVGLPPNKRLSCFIRIR